MSKFYRKATRTKSAVLFIIFNRPGTTARVFDEIRNARPNRLYVAADGPRPEREGEDELCNATRTIVNTIDWECEVKTLFRDTNLGCKTAVSSAIDWFFENEEEGIILEDDCLPGKTFFGFCDTLLEKYRNDTRIRHISGCNFQQGQKWGNNSYYFSNLTHVWGWASWRRVWKDHDKELNKYSTTEVNDLLKNIFDDEVIVDTWSRIFEDVKAGKINSWAYPLTFTNFFNNSLSIIPNNNLVNNIGFDGEATHTFNKDSFQANISINEITEITHPKVILPQRFADKNTLDHEFHVAEQTRKRNALHNRFKRWVRSLSYDDSLKPSHSLS